MTRRRRRRLHPIWDADVRTDDDDKHDVDLKFLTDSYDQIFALNIKPTSSGELCPAEFEMAEQHDTDCLDRCTFEVPWQNERLEITDETERS
eukprot:9298852-Heterocapsa_arctica.AAC.1